MQIKLDSIIAPSFYALHHHIKNHDYTHYWLKGGRGSTKSSFISIEIIKGMMENPERNSIVFRKIGGTLRESVYEQLIWAIDVLGVAHLWKARVNPLTLSYGKQRILFRGVDDPMKSKSIKLSSGYFAYIWFEELAEFPEMSAINTILQSVMRGGEDFWCLYSYNPPESIQSWVNYESAIPRADKIVHHSTYLSVPKKWLGEQFIVEANHMKSVDEQKYRHQYLGEATGTGGEVFNNVKLQSISDEAIQSFDKIYRGLDWGYAADPFAYVVMYYDKTRKKLYIFYEIYKLNLSNTLAAEYINCENINKELVICDSAEPKSISDIRERGVKAEGAVKGPGSVERGIRFLASDIEEIIIDPVRCPNVAREFTQYELEKDKFGNFKSVYPDKNNHTIDACRYALEHIGDAPRFGW